LFEQFKQELRDVSDRTVETLRQTKDLGEMRKILIEAGLETIGAIDGKFLMQEVAKFLAQRPTVSVKEGSLRPRLLRYIGKGRHLIAYSADSFDQVVKTPREPGKKTEDVLKFWINNGWELVRERLNGLTVPTMIINATDGSKKPFVYVLEKGEVQKVELAIIQRKVAPILERLKILAREKKIQEAKNLIDKYKEFVVLMFRRGIMDFDFTNPYCNYGVDLESGKIYIFDFGDLDAIEGNAYMFFESLGVTNKYFYDDLKRHVSHELANYFWARPIFIDDFYSRSGELLFGVDLAADPQQCKMSFPYSEERIRNIFLHNPDGTSSPISNSDVRCSNIIVEERKEEAELNDISRQVEINAQGSISNKEDLQTAIVAELVKLTSYGLDKDVRQARLRAEIFINSLEQGLSWLRQSSSQDFNEHLAKSRFNLELTIVNEDEADLKTVGILLNRLGLARDKNTVSFNWAALSRAPPADINWQNTVSVTCFEETRHLLSLRMPQIRQPTLRQDHGYIDKFLRDHDQRDLRASLGAVLTDEDGKYGIVGGRIAITSNFHPDLNRIRRSLDRKKPDWGQIKKDLRFILKNLHMMQDSSEQEFFLNLLVSAIFSIDDWEEKLELIGGEFKEEGNKQALANVEILGEKMGIRTKLQGRLSTQEVWDKRARQKLLTVAELGKEDAEAELEFALEEIQRANNPEEVIKAVRAAAPFLNNKTFQHLFAQVIAAAAGRGVDVSPHTKGRHEATEDLPQPEVLEPETPESKASSRQEESRRAGEERERQKEAERRTRQQQRELRAARGIRGIWPLLRLLG